MTSDPDDTEAPHPNPEPAKPSAPPEGAGGEASEHPGVEVHPGARVIVPAANVSVRVHGEAGTEPAGHVRVSSGHSAPLHVKPVAGTNYPGTVSRDDVALLRDECRKALRAAEHGAGAVGADASIDWLRFVRFLLRALSELLGERESG